jgi:hypothetical protein
VGTEKTPANRISANKAEMSSSGSLRINFDIKINKKNTEPISMLNPHTLTGNDLFNDVFKVLVKTLRLCVRRGIWKTLSPETAAE